MALPLLGLVSAVVPLIDKLIPDPEANARAKRDLVALEQTGELDMVKVSLSAIVAEAQSADPWTSRARPTFLYLIYAVILLCVVGSITGIWWPDHVTTAAQNLANLLAAIPESLWWLFGAGYLGYTGARSFDKWRGAGK